MLTLQKLKEMNPGEIIATGIALDNPDGLNMMNTGEKLRWVAIRGDIHDWAIYCANISADEEWIRRFGDKVHSDRHIRRLVECDDAAFKMYRH